MRQVIKTILLMGVLALGVRSAWGFSLLGPIGNNPNPANGGTGDSWQTPVIGYGYPGSGDLGSPKNIGEEYRRNIPVMYYAYDANFLGFFGLAGTTNVDAAVALLNGALNGQANTPLYLAGPTNIPVNLDTYSASLDEFPLDSQQINYEAQALALMDLKSVTMTFLMEQMGLADPERYVWTLHDRYLPPGGTCPLDEFYEVIQRNFDITASPLNQLQYSPYINGTLYTYFIVENCTGPNPLAITVPYPLDAFSDSFNTVAGYGNLYTTGVDGYYLNFGGYYTGLTRDDVGGLRYMLSASNINFENAGLGAQLLVTNISTNVLVTTLPLNLLTSQTLTPPAALQALFPGIAITQVNTNFVNVVATNFSAYFTNLPPPYTNLAGVPFTAWTPVQYASNQVLLTTLSFGDFLLQIQTNGPAALLALYPDLLISSVNTNFFSVVVTTNVTAFFTNSTGTVQYSTNQILVTTLSFADFLSAIQTNDPVTLQGLYPNLDITSVNTNFFDVAVATNVTAYFTNPPPPYTNTPPPPNSTLPSPYTVAFTNWSPVQYGPEQLLTTFSLADFLSVIQTNDPATLLALYPGLDILSVNTNFYTVLTTTNASFIFTNQSLPLPFTNPVPLITHTGSYFTNLPGPGAINYAQNPILLFTLDLSLFLQQSLTNDPVTLQGLYPGLVIIDYSYYFTNIPVPNIVNYLTNTTGSPYGGPPVAVTVTNGFTWVYTQVYSYEFGNVVTNTYYTNTPVTLTTVSVTSQNGAPFGSPPVTNTVTKTFYTNQISGDFFIMPTNWCGYRITQLLTTNLTPGATNIVVFQGYTNTLTGTPYSLTKTYTYNYTNHVFAIEIGTCEPVAQIVTNLTTSIVTAYQYSFLNIVTNTYYTNNYFTVIVTNISATNGGTVGTLSTNVTVTTTLVNSPSGDFWIIPTNWCGYQVVGLLTNVVSTTNTVVSTIPPGVPDIGQQYSVTTISQFTNHTFAIRPGVCQQALTFATNYTASIITQYQYTFQNVLTNNFFTNTFETATATNIEAVTNGLAGQLTNTTTMTAFYAPQPSGDFWIVPTNWCGYQLVTLLTNLVFTTNTFAATNTGSIGQQYAVTTVSEYTNYTFAIRPGTCESVLVFATNYTTNIVGQYQYTFFNVITNNYFTNTFETVITSNTVALTNGLVGQVTNIITTNSFYAPVPSGDFWIVPTNWCGYQLVDLLTNLVLTTSTFVATNTGTSGEEYSVTTISQYTNYTFAIRPGTCVPALAFATNYTTNIATEYSYTFGNVVTNPTSFSTNSFVTVTTTNLEPVTNGLLGQLTDSVTSTNVVLTNVNSGDFFIVPPAWCGYTIIATQLVSTVYSTNVFAATNLPGINNVGQQYTVTTVSSFSNYTFVIQPQICTLEAPPAALREGIEKVQFVRANFDSLLGQFFQPITNDYTMVKVTNSQAVVEYYQRVVTRPDITFSAVDNTGPLPGFFEVTRTVPGPPNPWFDQGNALPGLAGPGVINPPTTIAFNKVGNIYLNGSLALYAVNNYPFLNQGTQGSIQGQGLGDGLSMLQWASFDGSTNDPVVYPNGTSIQDLQNQILIQISPPSLPDGTNGIAYSATFSATGGQPPYTWAVSTSPGLPPGLGLSGSTISGTPDGSAGTYDFTIQLTDSVNRVVTLNYSIIIH